MKHERTRDWWIACEVAIGRVANLSTVTADNRWGETVSRHRLPRNVLPRTYRVVLEPDLVATTFRGSVDVAVEVVQPTTEVILNAAELTIECVIVSDRTGEQPCTWHLNEAEQQLVLQFDVPLSAGMANLSFVYDGVLNDRLEGFYRSTYDGPDGKPVTIATTQFQATDARLAMPCFDEPDMKAVFEVSLVVASGLTAVANTAEVERHTLDDGRTRIRFAPTIPMSTYLVAFVVGDLEMTEPRMVRNTPVRVVHRPGQAHLTNFALDVAEHSLALFEDYYGIPYRGDKLDLVALPDFAAGAMENLGCITFREVLLLVDPASATQPELQDVVDVVGHEIAHLWFGDLVTMKWWNGIWLNEAFATFMELKATDAFRPDWQRWDTFAISRFSAAEVDSLASTRAVEFEVVTPADASAMFDVLTYLKGASVVRMLEQYLGEDVFRDGIRHYLRTHEYGNTETHDLWDSLEAVSGEPVRAMMETWIFQGGYPMVDVSVKGRTATLSQRRFRLDTSSQDDTRWMVPIRLRVADAELRTRLDGPTMTLELPEGGLVTANAGGTGFYRVALDDPPDLAQLGALATIERAIIVDDTWALVLAGHLPVTRFFALADLLRSETDVTVWQRLLGCLGQLSFSVADALGAAYASARPWPRPAGVDRTGMGAHGRRVRPPTITARSPDPGGRWSWPGSGRPRTRLWTARHRRSGSGGTRRGDQRGGGGRRCCNLREPLATKRGRHRSSGLSALPARPCGCP